MPTTTDTGFTLTQATIVGRQAVKVVVIGLVALIVGRTFLGAAISYYRAVNPPPPPPPTVGFGILPPVSLGTDNRASEVTSYTLQIPNSRLPVFSDRAKVYLLNQQALGLLSDQQARQIATQYNFLFAPEVLDASTYRWTKAQPLESVLEMNLNNFYFKFRTDYLSRPELLSGQLPTQAEAVERVKTMLSSVDLLPSDVATASADVTYLKALGGELQPAVSFSDADFIQVDITRYPIDSTFRMFTPAGYEGTIHGIVSKGLNGTDSVVHLDYRHQEVDYTQVHTYPLRPVAGAWQLVQAGQGYVVNPGNGTVVVRSVSLGYFDSFTPQAYLQPIYVFEGDNGFLAYVPALDPSFIQSTQTQP